MKIFEDFRTYYGLRLELMEHPILLLGEMAGSGGGGGGGGGGGAGPSLDIC